MMSERMKVLIAYDGSSSAQAALEGLRRAGLSREVEAVVLSAVNVDLPPAPDFVSATSVEAESWGADSIFVGSRGLDSAFKRFFLGSVSSAVVANASCSVEVVR